MPDRKSSKLPFFTIGHSNRTTEEFLRLLEASRVACVVDVRKITMSRSNPQFNADTLAQSLQHHGIDYRHLAALGGLRSKQPNQRLDVNSFWKNRSFHNYADYALSNAFGEGLMELIEEGRRRVCAIMCAEAVWWRCHRRLIADNLIARGETVYHILDTHHIDRATLTPGAVVRPDRTVVYAA